MRKLIASLIAVASLTACADADVVSRNLSKDADYFKVERRIVFYNGITGGYMLVIEGKCALGNNDPTRQLTVTCKTGADQFKKHFLGLSDNVTYFVEQVDGHKSDPNHYKVIFNPSVIIPSIEIR